MTGFDKSLQPIAIGNLRAMNRFVMAAQYLGWSEDGAVNQRLIDFFVERARGEVGLIIVGGFVVHPLGLMALHPLMIDGDRYLGPMRG
jgi:2,4-dienoyl-CoA reductase (NADPH2)